MLTIICIKLREENDSCATSLEAIRNQRNGTFNNDQSKVIRKTIKSWIDCAIILMVNEGNM